jgi:pentatricopeptide repeat protein
MFFVRLQRLVCVEVRRGSKFQSRSSNFTYTPRLSCTSAAPAINVGHLQVVNHSKFQISNNQFHSFSTGAVAAVTEPRSNSISTSDEVTYFLNTLDSFSYGNDERRLPITSRLKKLISTNRDNPSVVGLLLQKCVAFEMSYSRCQAAAIVDADCFFYAIQIFLRHDQVERADELLSLGLSLRRIQMDPKCFSRVMNGYMQQKTQAGLKRIEEMIAVREEQRIEGTKRYAMALDSKQYAALMNAYIGVLEDKALDPCKRTIARMTQIAKQLNSVDLLPNMGCFAALMKACILRREPDYMADVNKIIATIRTSERLGNESSRSFTYVYNMAIDAWCKSGHKKAPQMARELFDAIEQPDTVSYSLLCQLYLQVGNPDEAIGLSARMHSEFVSGKNKLAAPNHSSCAFLLKALQQSNRHQPRALELAQTMVNDLGDDSSTILYTQLLNLYVKYDKLQESVDLLQKMQASKKSKPSNYTYAGVLKALQKTPNKKGTAKKAWEIFQTISAPDTVVYNAMLSIFARHGLINRAQDLVEQMKSEYKSGKNKTCRPDLHTYSTLLNAVEKSNKSNDVQLGESIFASIPQPDTVACNTLLNIYSERGLARRALALVRRMQSDFDSGKNRNCRPSDVTERTLLKALDWSQEQNLEEEARDVVEWFRASAYSASTLLGELQA